MVTVGIRELKSRLSKYVRLAQAGEVVRVTDRGTVVAELRRPNEPVGPTGIPALDRMIQEGAVTAARQDSEPNLYAQPDRPRLAPGVALRLLDETRGEE